MGVSNPVMEKLVEEVGKRVDAEQHIISLEMEFELCHVWFDAAGIPRLNDDGKSKKTLLQRLAIYTARYLERDDYNTLMENWRELVGL